MGKLRELDTQSAIIEILGRLQPWIQLRWKNLALDAKKKEGKYPDFLGFVDFVAEVAADVSDPMYGKLNTHKQITDVKGQKPKKQSFPAQCRQILTIRYQLTLSRRWQEPPCVLCSEKHRLWR